MTLENEYLTHDDKPYTENFNSSKLVSDIFDLTIPVIYPDNCKTPTWGQVGSVKKCHVGIVEIKEASSGLDINTGEVSGTGTLKVMFYPNFDTFDKITCIDWLYDTGTVTCDLYTQTGQLIQENIPNGAQTSASAELKKLQNFELRFNLTNADLNSFRVVMKNTKKSPVLGKIGQSDVTDLETRLTSIESKNTEQDTAISGKASSTHTHGNITNDGKIGTTANKPLKTTKDGEIITGSFGTGPYDFATGGHTHGNIDVGGHIGSVSGKVITTGSSGILKASDNIPQSSVDGLTTALDGKASNNLDTGWTNGVFNLNTYTGTFKGMIRNGFATIIINYKLNGATSQTSTVIGHLPVVFSPSSDGFELPLKRYGDSDGVEKPVSVKPVIENNKVYFVIYADRSIQSTTGFAGAFTYPVDGY